MRATVRRLYMGLATVLGIGKLGFFIPYRYARHIRPLPHQSLLALFQDREESFRDVLSTLAALAPDLTAIGSEPPPAPRWAQDWFPGLDGAVAYTMVRTLRPGRIIEIGSGHSTRFFARGGKDGGLDLAITAIDPAPRADITRLGVNVIEKTVQDAGLAPFAELRRGDILSIDSSHILMPGSDVDLLLGSVLAMLPEGAIIHIHDMFLPDCYPEQWNWRGYNEQSAVAPLLHSGGYRVLWSSRYVRTRMADQLVGELFDVIKPPAGGYESSLWLIKQAYS